MDSAAVTRAVVSAGVFAGIAYAISGGAANINDYAMSAAVQAGASLGSDAVHRVVMMEPTHVTSAVAAGGLYTAAQFLLRGETNFLNNYGVSAGSEWAARTAVGMWSKPSAESAVDEAWNTL